MVTVSQTPIRTGNSGTQDFGEFICKMVAVVVKKIVSTESASIISGTPFDATYTHFTISSWRVFKTSGTRWTNMAI